MKGIDIIEAMQDIDENLIFQAKLHKKVPPAWLKFTSIAACFCCVLLLGALSISKILSFGSEEVPETLASGVESEVAASEDYYVSTDTPLKWEQPAGLEDCIEFSEDGKTMTMFDPVSRTVSGDDMGVIWQINIVPMDEFDPESIGDPKYAADTEYAAKEYGDGWYGYFDPFTYMYARDEENVYLLNIPSKLQYDANSVESGNSYFIHTRHGIDILSSIITLNDLELNPNWNQDISVQFFGTIGFNETLDEYSAESDDNSDFDATLSSCSTVSTADENRTINLLLACNAIDGTVLEPGETFSFNDVVGERTAEKGYREAAIYGHEDDPVLGGGISQISSTLYAACFYADLEIVERQAHVFQPEWIPGGLDAAVYWGSVDFQFRNNTDHPIQISAYMSNSSVEIKLLTTMEPSFKVYIYTTYSGDATQNVYELDRYVYDLNGNLLRTDTIEDLNALGDLGTTIYSPWPDDTGAEQATAEPTTSEPASDVTEHPAYVLMEEDLIFGNGVTIGMTPSEVIPILGTPITDEIYGENDMYRDFNYGDADCFFRYCDHCNDYHVLEFYVSGENAPNLPFGFTYGMPLNEVLAFYGAEDAVRSQRTVLYQYDDTHWAEYSPVNDTGLVSIDIFVGNYTYSVSFDRNDEIYIMSITPSNGVAICPYAD